MSKFARFLVGLFFALFAWPGDADRVLSGDEVAKDHRAYAILLSLTLCVTILTLTMVWDLFVKSITPTGLFASLTCAIVIPVVTWLAADRRIAEAERRRADAAAQKSPGCRADF